MDFGFIWILFLAFLGIPAVICFLLVSKINALGDSLDTIHEEISALQQMMRENRKKEERKPAGPAATSTGSSCPTRRPRSTPSGPTRSSSRPRRGAPAWRSPRCAQTARPPRPRPPASTPPESATDRMRYCGGARTPSRSAGPDTEGTGVELRRPRP